MQILSSFFAFEKVQRVKRNPEFQNLASKNKLATLLLP